MSTHLSYKTKQRERLIHYFEQKPGVHITAGEICEFFSKQEEPIGQSTVYRQLERLVDEGILNKYTIDGTSSACFEYVGEIHHDEKEICFHCKCEKCGKLIHMHCEEFLAIQEHLWGHHRFTLDPMRTVFYGLCEECGSHQE